jgi:DNA-binding NarL/FixJ family response regulator
MTLPKLTRRETQVAELLLLGFRNREIAATLGTGPRTVEEQRRSIFKKCNVRNPVELLRLQQDLPLREASHDK